MNAILNGVIALIALFHQSTGRKPTVIHMTKGTWDAIGKEASATGLVYAVPGVTYGHRIEGYGVERIAGIPVVIAINIADVPRETIEVG